MTIAFTESVVEEAALAWLKSLGYSVLHGPDITAGEPDAERSDPNYRDVVLERRLRQALRHLNPDLPAEALEDAYRKLTRTDAPSLVERNRAMHRMLIEGIPVEYLQPSPRPSPTGRGRSEAEGEGLRRWGIVRVIDFDDPSANDWLAVNQFTVAEGQHTRRPDVVLFVNGLPLAVFELKNPADENATIWSAYQQLQTYQAQIPSLFTTNAALIISDGVQARIGSLGAGREWFKPWRTITGKEDYASPLPSPRPDRHPSPRGRGVAVRGKSTSNLNLKCFCWGCSRSDGSSTLYGTSSCSRTRRAANSPKRWRATTSSTR